MILKIAMAVVSGIILCICIGYNIDLWKDFTRNEDIRVKWKTFLSMYRISPKKFSFKYSDMYNCYSLTYGNYHIGLSFPAFLLFKRWIPRQEELKRQEEKRETSEKVLKEWQKDINTYRDNAQKEINDMFQRGRKI
jgi:hypothetical protein